MTEQDNNSQLQGHINSPSPSCSNTPNCPLCHSNKHVKPYYQIQGKPSFKCHACEHIFNKPFRKKCAYCGKIFETTKSNQFFCSAICQEKRAKYNYKPKLKVKIIKKCKWCHGEFEAKRGIHFFCCGECSVFYNQMKRRVFSNFSFEPEYSREMSKLEKLGCDYKLQREVT